MKLKELKPKYEDLELIEDDGTLFTTPMFIKLEDAIRRYGDRNVLSTRVFEDTKTTSVIIEAGNYL